MCCSQDVFALLNAGNVKGKRLIRSFRHLVWYEHLRKLVSYPGNGPCPGGMHVAL